MLWGWGRSIGFWLACRARAGVVPALHYATTVPVRWVGIQHGNTAAALAFPPRSMHPFQVYELHARRPGSWMISTVPFSVVWVPFLFGTRIQTITHLVTLSDSFVS